MQLIRDRRHRLVSTCSLYPIQEVVWPLALRLVPTSQALGRSARTSARTAHRQPSSRLGSFACRGAAPACAAASATIAAFGFGAAFSRASCRGSRGCAPPDGHPSKSISVSPDGWPDRSRHRKRPAFASTSPRSEAGRHRSSRTAGIAAVNLTRRSIRPRVVGTSNTALAMKARASAARSLLGRPTWPRK